MCHITFCLLFLMIMCHITLKMQDTSRHDTARFSYVCHGSAVAASSQERGVSYVGARRTWRVARRRRRRAAPAARRRGARRPAARAARARRRPCAAPPRPAPPTRTLLTLFALYLLLCARRLGFRFRGDRTFLCSTNISFRV